MQLPNALRALLISDPSTMSVDAGEKDAEESRSESVEGTDDDDEEEEDEEEEEEEDEGASGKKAACALCVGVGSLSDPPRLDGLAHFTEHMLFMGTKKYPDENEWYRIVT